MYVQRGIVKSKNTATSLIWLQIHSYHTIALLKVVYAQKLTDKIKMSSQFYQEYELQQRRTPYFKVHEYTFGAQ